MNFVKIALSQAKTEVNSQSVFGCIAFFLICLGIIVNFLGNSIGLETDVIPIITSGLGLIGSLIYIFIDVGAKFHLFLCGIFTAIFLISLGRLFG